MKFKPGDIVSAVGCLWLVKCDFPGFDNCIYVNIYQQNGEIYDPYNTYWLFKEQCTI